MSSPVIKVDHLTKEYTLTHAGRERYVALRDVITRGAASFEWALKDVSFEVTESTGLGRMTPESYSDGYE